MSVRLDQQLGVDLQGRAKAPEVIERLRRLAKSILRRCSAEQIVGAGGGA